MTNEDLAQAVAINSAIEKLSSIVENKGEPMGLFLGMGTEFLTFTAGMIIS